MELCPTDAGGKLTGASVFPSVCAVLRSSEGSDGVTSPPTSWAAVRQAAIEDLRRLPVTILPHVLGAIAEEKPKLEAVVADASLLLGSVWRATDAVVAGESVLEVIAAIEPYVEDVPSASKGALRDWLVAMSAVAAEARVEIYKGLAPNATRWVPTDEQLTLLVALVIDHLPVGTDVVEDFLKTPEGQASVRELVAHLTELAARAKQAQVEGADEEAMLRLLESLSGLLEAVGRMIRRHRGITGSVSCDRDEPDATVCAVVVLDGSALVVGTIGSLRRAQYTAALSQFIAWFEPVLGAQQLPSWLRGWAPFLADLASARDSESMQGVLESLAAPVGSYKIKRGTIYRTDDGSRMQRAARKQARKEGTRNVHAMINAYVGVQAGGEVLLGDGGWGFHVGPTASIGPEINWGLGERGSLGLYLPILDVGSLADFRIGGNGLGSSMSSEEVVEAPAKPGFAQVFAPGGYLVFGLGRSPLALAVGAQVAPALRSTDINGDGSTFTVVQVGGLLAIDIPVWIFR